MCYKVKSGKIKFLPRASYRQLSHTSLSAATRRIYARR